MHPERATGILLARNAALNFLGHGWLLVLGLVSAPILFHRLGAGAYGVLAIASVVIGYFGVLDLGIGRAAVKFVAETLAQGQHGRVRRIVATTVGSQLLLGMLGTGILWISAPVLVDRILNVPSGLAAQARLAIAVMALSLPLTLVGGAYEGVLMAAQRFDLITLVRIVVGTLRAGLAIALVMSGMGIRGAVLAMITAQAVHLVVMTAVVGRLLPNVGRQVTPQADEFRVLLRYGGWLTVSSLVGPVLVYLDRFLVGTLLSIQAVSYYTIPYDAVTKLWIVPYAIVPVLFPAFAALQSSRIVRQELVELYVRSAKFAFSIMAPVVILIVGYAPQLLRVWVGEELAMQGSRAMQVLAVGVLINSLAQIPFGLVQALGRPDVTAKFHLAEIPLYVAICFWAIPKWGVAGAATAWTFRVLIDGTLLAVFAARILNVPLSNNLHRTYTRAVTLSGALVMATIAVKTAPTSARVEVLLVALILNMYALGVWRFVMSSSERAPLLGLFSRVRLKVGSPS